MRTAFVMSGGGEKGAYGVGALEHLLVDLNLDFDLYVGVSVGNLVGAWMAQYPEDEKSEGFRGLKELFLGIETEDVHRSWLWGSKYLGYVWAVLSGKPSLRCSAPLRELIQRYLDPAKLRSSGKAFRAGAVSYSTGRYRVFSERDDPLPKIIEASAAYPLGLEPAELEGQWWGDGGIRTLTPIKAAIEAGAERIVAVTLAASDPEDHFSSDPSLVDVGLRTIGLQNEEIVTSDIRIAQLYNLAIALAAKLEEVGVSDAEVDAAVQEAGFPSDYASKKLVPIVHIRPERSLATPVLEFSKGESRRIFDLGRADAVAAMSAAGSAWLP